MEGGNMEPEKCRDTYRGELENLVRDIEAALPDTVNVNAVAYACAMVLNRMMLGNGYTTTISFVPILGGQDAEILKEKLRLAQLESAEKAHALVEKLRTSQNGHYR
jgi:hypothetical protein